MYSYGPPHMAVQKQDDQNEHTFSSYVRIRDVVLKTYQGRWTKGRSGERGSGISVLPARYDDDNTKSCFWIYIRYIWFGLVGIYSISTIYRQFNTKSCFWIYIKYIWFGLVGIYSISTIVGYLMPNLFYEYIWNIYDLVRLDFMVY